MKKKNMFSMLSNLYERSQALIPGISENTAENLLEYVNFDEMNKMATREYFTELIKIYLGICDKYKTKAEFFKDYDVKPEEIHDEEITAVRAIKNAAMSFISDIDEKKSELESVMGFFKGKNI